MAMQDAIRICEQVERLVLDAQMDTARTAERLQRTAQRVAKSKNLIGNGPVSRSRQTAPHTAQKSEPTASNSVEKTAKVKAPVGAGPVDTNRKRR